jgi:hydrogenase maturation protease
VTGGDAALPIAKPPPLVIGLGSEHRGDDACGIEVARRLRPRLEGLGEVIERAPEAADLMELWNGRGLVVVVDAFRSGAAPGTVHRIPVGAEPLPVPLNPTSSHGLSLAHAVAFGQLFHRFPAHLVVYGIEAAQFDMGAPLSSEVEHAIGAVVGQIEQEVRQASASSLRLHGAAATDA